jgi:hypothetical protein
MRKLTLALFFLHIARIYGFIWLRLQLALISRSIAKVFARWHRTRPAGSSCSDVAAAAAAAAATRATRSEAIVLETTRRAGPLP